MKEKPVISHVGIAVKDLFESIKKYKLLTGDNAPVIEDVTDQKVTVAIFKSGNKETGGRVELVSPASPDSPISRFLEKNNEGLHHICIYVNDIEKKLAELKEAGVKLIDETPRIGTEGNKIAFVHPKDCSGVLIELEERN